MSATLPPRVPDGVIRFQVKERDHLNVCLLFLNTEIRLRQGMSDKETVVCVHVCGCMGMSREEGVVVEGGGRARKY